MQLGTFQKISGTVETDETFVGGKAKFMHKSVREQKVKGRGSVGKAIVLGMLQRDGEVRAKVVRNTRKETLQAEVRDNVAAQSELFTDALSSYKDLDDEYLHQVVDHAVEYVKGNVHTNGIENFWCLLKRTIKGTYVSVEPAHLTRYLDEQVFRFNQRKGTDADRFVKAVASVVGRRLTYEELTSSFASEQRRA